MTGHVKLLRHNHNVDIGVGKMLSRLDFLHVMHRMRNEHHQTENDLLYITYQNEFELDCQILVQLAITLHPSKKIPRRVVRSFFKTSGVTSALVLVVDYLEDGCHPPLDHASSPPHFFLLSNNNQQQPTALTLCHQCNTSIHISSLSSYVRVHLTVS